MRTLKNISQWETLMNLALPILQDLPKDIPWALGGGTALSLSLQHRISYDIDIFFEYTKAIREIARNPKTKEIALSIQFPGNYLKIEREEGEIDFISAMNITDYPHKNYLFQDQNIFIENVDEIIAKKLKYRSSRLNIRDVFDLAASINNDQNILNRMCNIEDIANELNTAFNRINLLIKSRIKIDIITNNEYLHKNMFDITISALNDILDKDTDFSLR